VKETALDEEWGDENPLACNLELVDELCKERWRVLCKGQRSAHKLNGDAIKLAKSKVISRTRVVQSVCLILVV
jgi:hypothetical protein